MKYVDEFRDRAVAAALAERIKKTVRRPWTIMEVCGKKIGRESGSCNHTWRCSRPCERVGRDGSHDSLFASARRALDGPVSH